MQAAGRAAMSDGSGAPARAKRRKRAGHGVQGPAKPAFASGGGGAAAIEAVAGAEPEAWAVRVWRRLIGEPSLGLSVAYLLMSMIGLWTNYWFYRQFGLPILEYMHAGDYLVAGLRDPGYALVLAGSVLVAWLVSWPEIYRKQHPRRVREIQRRWWGRLVFPEAAVFRWTLLRMKPETGIALMVFVGMAMTTCSYVIGKAARIRERAEGHVVQVSLAGESAPLPGDARLLGTSSAYVFLWWPGARRAEALPIESVGRLQTPPLSRQRGATPARPPAETPVPASAAAATAP